MQIFEEILSRIVVDLWLFPMLGATLSSLHLFAFGHSGAGWDGAGWDSLNLPRTCLDLPQGCLVLPHRCFTLPQGRLLLPRGLITSTVLKKTHLFCFVVVLYAKQVFSFDVTLFTLLLVSNLSHCCVFFFKQPKEFVSCFPSTVSPCPKTCLTLPHHVSPCPTFFHVCLPSISLKCWHYLLYYWIHFVVRSTKFLLV